MCQSQTFLKSILSLFTFVTIGVGLAGIIFGIVRLVNIGGHLDFDTFNPVTFSTVALLVTGCLALFIGITGMVGARKKSKCCLCIYNFSVFPLLAITLVLAGFSTYANIQTGKMDDLQSQLNNCDYRSQTCVGCGEPGWLNWITEFNTWAQQITTTIYGTDSCPIEAASEVQRQSYLGINPNLKVVLQGQGGYNNALNCPTVQLESNSSSLKSVASFLYFFESTNTCSGMCANTPYYVFYDSTKGFLNSENTFQENYPSCYGSIVDFMGNTTVLIVSWCLFAYFLLNVILSCCLCCHPDRKQQSGDMYARLNYYE